MSLHPEAEHPVPQMTQLVAKTAFLKCNVWIKMRNEFGTLFQDKQFTVDGH